MRKLLHKGLSRKYIAAKTFITKQDNPHTVCRLSCFFILYFLNPITPETVFGLSRKNKKTEKLISSPSFTKFSFLRYFYIRLRNVSEKISPFTRVASHKLRHQQNCPCQFLSGVFRSFLPDLYILGGRTVFLLIFFASILV